MKKRLVAILFGVATMLSGTVGAHSPARRACTLTKSQTAKALKQAQPMYPVERPADEHSCYCNFATDDCSLLDVTFAPVKVEAKKSNVVFNVRVEAAVWMKRPKNMFVDDPTKAKPFDFERAAAAIRKLRVARVFGEDPLFCDVRVANDNVDFACGGEHPREALGGGRPQHGARAFGAWVERSGKIAVGTIVGPAALVTDLDDPRWLRVSDNEDVTKFLSEHPDATIALMARDEVGIFTSPVESEGSTIKTSLSVRDGKAQVHTSRRSAPVPARPKSESN